MRVWGEGGRRGEREKTENIRENLNNATVRMWLRR